jgi:hypothetical protein
VYLCVRDALPWRLITTYSEGCVMCNLLCYRCITALNQHGLQFTTLYYQCKASIQRGLVLLWPALQGSRLACSALVRPCLLIKTKSHVQPILWQSKDFVATGIVAGVRICLHAHQSMAFVTSLPSARVEILLKLAFSIMRLSKESVRASRDVHLQTEKRH